MEKSSLIKFASKTCMTLNFHYNATKYQFCHRKADEITQFIFKIHPTYFQKPPNFLNHCIGFHGME